MRRPPILLVLVVGMIAAGLSPVAAQVSGWVQPNATTGFDVYPTYVDDHGHIEWALENAAPGSTVNLVGVQFLLSRGVDAINFCGT